MSEIRVAEDIVPMSEFKAEAKKWLGHIARSNGPMVLTQNGRAAGVLLSPRAYDLLVARADFVDAVQAGIADATAGRVVTHGQLVAEMEQRYGDPKKS